MFDADFVRMFTTDEVSKDVVRVVMESILDGSKLAPYPIEWNEEDNLYVGILVSELRTYRNLVPIRDSVYFHGKDYNEVIEMFYQACDNYERFRNIKND